MSIDYGRRSTDFPRQRIVAGLFYYLCLTILLAALLLTLYWQLEEDTAVAELSETSFVSTPIKRSFFVPIKFCSKKVDSDITLIRYYHDLKQNIYYGVPDGRYKTITNGCFDTRVSASTGRLDPGLYEYHVYVEYELNPLRTIRHKVAIVNVSVE